MHTTPSVIKNVAASFHATVRSFPMYALTSIALLMENSSAIMNN